MNGFVSSSFRSLKGPADHRIINEGLMIANTPTIRRDRPPAQLMIFWPPALAALITPQGNVMQVASVTATDNPGLPAVGPLANPDELTIA